VIVDWAEFSSDYENSDSFAQHLDALGNKLWPEEGMPVGTGPGQQGFGWLIPDGDGGFLTAWVDNRLGDQELDIRARRIDEHGYLGRPSPAIRSVIDHPADQGGVTVLSWAASPYDEFPLQEIFRYSVWKRLPGTSARTGDGLETEPGATDTDSDAATAEEAMDRAGWTYVDDVPATYQDEYGFDAPTYEDYTGGPDFPLTEYKVIAHASDPWVFWESDVRSGCSVDNLAPGAPLTLTALPDETDVLLTWEASGEDDEDLAHYNVYRGSAPGFTADENSLIGTTADIEFTDPNPGYGTWYYRVAGEDVHGNVGTPSNEAAVPVSTSTVGASLTCTPPAGVLPTVTGFSVQLTNRYLGQTRRIDGRIHVTLASGRLYTNWRAGFTNIAAGGTYSTGWNQPIPALTTLVGGNLFRLVAADVTPAPYNQPPYPPAGDTDSDTATFTGIAP
jgi:hypothetical protein